MDAMDMLVWGGFAIALGLAAVALDELYEWFVEPSRHHTPPASVPRTSELYPGRNP